MKGPWINTVGILQLLQMLSAHCHIHRIPRASKANRERDVQNKAIWIVQLSKAMSHINERTTKGSATPLPLSTAKVKEKIHR